LSSSVPLPNNTDVRDAYQLRSFLTYKNLLEIHNIKKDHNINLFQLLVKGVLKYFKPTGLNKPLGEAWDDIENLLEKSTSRSYNITRKRQDLNEQIELFNRAFGQLFTPPTPTMPSPDYISDVAAPILRCFDKDIQIGLKYNWINLDMQDPNAMTLHNKTVDIDVMYAGQKVSKPHLILNEARLSAIAISIYLGMIKRLPQSNKIKILFLDDLFIGLDLSNRMPLMQILEREFSDYQIIISTYDKPWYEVTKLYLHGNKNWKSIEFLARKNQLGYDQPMIRYTDDPVKRYIDIAREYHDSGDNKAAGVYLRGAFEFILKRYCYRKKLNVKFEIDLSKLNTEDFWIAIRDYQKANSQKCYLTPTTISDVEFCRKFVLNPLCHEDQTKHEYSSEIKKAIDVLEKLHAELTRK
jgi:hypothetical protein